MMKNTFNAMLKNRPKGQKVNQIFYMDSLKELN